MARCESCGFEAEAPFRFCPECGAPAATRPARHEQRKVVTIVFCDVTGSTALAERLDPETLRTLLGTYFERMKAIVERHGGTVEKFIGDAVMAVFGVPVLHEDDAMRAVRAAAEMRDALPELGVEGRIGVTTGEVVAGTEERLAVGDPVNVAARLQQVAQPGEVLIGTETLQLVHGAVRAEAVEPLTLKGKSAPVTAYRLVSVGADPDRPRLAPMVGRDRQRRLLADAFAGLTADRACHLFTVLGAAGVGKSRLAAEFLGDLDARVVAGRCLSYGEGITYWPVVEILKQLESTPADEAARTALASLLGESLQATTPDDIAWAFRKTLQEAASERPVVCVVDDLHWAEQALLDLVEHVADWSRDAPILLLCMARPELLDRRPGWAGGKLNATTVLLEPLSEQETDELIERLVGESELDSALQLRIARAAEGNPLFVEEMLALVRESGDGEVAVPPSIQALLAARLDQLDPHERAVLERGAVEGKTFHRTAVEALAPGETHVSSRLLALVRKELVRPDRPVFAGDDAFRFRHLLIRDAAYDALPKSVRAELHERFAAWLEEHGESLVELDEILGYHLEQACRYRRELGVPPNAALADAARSHLVNASRRAVRREDFAAAANLLERAHALLDAGTLSPALAVDLVATLHFAGRLEDAVANAERAAQEAAAAGEPAMELCLRLAGESVRTFVEPEGAIDRLAALTERALPLYETSGDDLGLYVTHHALAVIGHMSAQMAVWLAETELSIAHAQAAGLGHHARFREPALGAARSAGPTPVPEYLAWVEERELADPGDVNRRVHRAECLSMLGRHDEARSLMAEVRAEEAERGRGLGLPIVTWVSSGVEWYAGETETATELAARACALFEQIGESGMLSTAVCDLAQIHYQLGDLEAAEAAYRRGYELGAPDDLLTQANARQVEAKVLAQRGRQEEAQRMARDAIKIIDQTDILGARADAYADLGEVLALGGDVAGARDAFEEAARHYERKGHVVGMQRTQTRLEQLASTGAAT